MISIAPNILLRLFEHYTDLRAESKSRFSAYIRLNTSICEMCLGGTVKDISMEFVTFFSFWLNDYG